MKTNRVFTPTRVAALAVIGALVFGLGYLRFSPDAPVSVPPGAESGDLMLEPCTYETEEGDSPAECGTLVVPETREDPGSRLIALPVIRIPARSDRAAEPIFLLWGGPGITNMGWTHANRYADHHDVVMVGYRGVDGSVRLDCPEVESAIGHSTDILGEEFYRAYGNGFRDCAARLRAEGVDPTAYGLTHQVEDLEAARVALGYDRIDLLSESAGTRTAMIYAWRYPESIHRSVMVAVNPPGNYMWDPETTDEQIARYTELCSKDASCRERTDDLAATIRRTIANMPERWYFLPIDESTVRIASFFGMMETTSENAPSTGPTTVDAWLSAAEGDASGFWFASLFGDLVLPKAFVWGQYAAAGRVDAQDVRDYFGSGEYAIGSNLGYDSSAFVWGGGRMVDGWPAAADENEFRRVRTSDVETLLIGGELDFAMPPQVASEELLPYLPNGHEVVLPGFGHTTSFFSDQPEAGTRLITTFFESGEVDDSLYSPQAVDFTPEPTQTALAKGIAGTMVGLALITVLSLLWMARRVHRRGRIGPKAGATLRSLYTIVLGFGGWFLGVLIIMTAGLAIPLGGGLLAVLGVGLPIGLGVFFAWVRRDWPAGTKTGGFVGAMGGAIVGGWLGFHSTTDLLALVTTIVGAAAGANLILIFLDISRARGGRSAPSAPGDRVPERVDA